MAVQLQGRVAANLEAARRLARLTKPEVAGALGVDVRAITRWEAGTSIPTPANLVALGDLYGFDAGWFWADHGRDAG